MSESRKIVFPAWLERILLRAGVIKKKIEAPVEEESETCCKGVVHIAYRGVSDERLYLAEHRKWGDVRFFKPNGLRVFCADCRRRIY